MSKLAAIHPSEQGTTTAQVSIGHRYEDAFGRVYYYGFAAAAVGRGKLALEALVIANHTNQSFQTAPAVGDKIVKVTLGGTALTAEQYKEGWLVVQDGTGEGRAYRIEGNDAQTGTTSTATLYLQEAIDTAGATGQLNVDFIYNSYDELRVAADTGQTDIPAGVPFMVDGLGASEFGQLQTWGPCSVERDAAETLGEMITLGTGTHLGQVESYGNVNEPVIGQGGPAVGVADEYQLMYLRLTR